MEAAAAPRISVQPSPANVTSIQRLATHGGVEPAQPCDAANAGNEARVRYTADYYFYKRKQGVGSGPSTSLGRDLTLFYFDGRAQATSYCDTLAVLREFCGCSPAYFVPAVPLGLNAEPGAFIA